MLNPTDFKLILIWRSQQYSSVSLTELSIAINKTASLQLYLFLPSLFRSISFLMRYSIRLATCYLFFFRCIHSNFSSILIRHAPLTNRDSMPFARIGEYDARVRIMRQFNLHVIEFSITRSLDPRYTSRIYADNHKALSPRVHRP